VPHRAEGVPLTCHLCWSKRWSGFEESVELAGDVAHQTAFDLAVGLVDAVAADDSRVRQLPARPIRADRGGVRQRLQAAYQQERPDAKPWTARTLAAAAGCGRSSAASFLQTQPVAEEEAGS
jgi:hypothetical protein